MDDRKIMKKNDFIEKTLAFSKTIDIDLIEKFVAFDEVLSTNLKAKELAEKKAKQGTIIISKTQKKGRGRFNRTWESPVGGLYFSIILKPKCKPDKTTLLPLVGALSVCKTITAISDLYVKIKWPNDVLINGKKVSGILLESEYEKNNLKYVILGIGINSNTDLSSLSDDLRPVSTSIAYEIGINLNYYDFLKKLLINLDKYYKTFNEKKYDTLIKEWKNNSDTLDRQICIDTSKEKITGTAFDIDESGFLLVKTDNGDVKKITSGDCIYFDKKKFERKN